MCVYIFVSIEEEVAAAQNNNNNNNVVTAATAHMETATTITPTAVSLTGSPLMHTNRYGTTTSSSPPSHPQHHHHHHSQTVATNPLHTIAQPYPAENSNFGAFYHHHGHMPSYGNPYDKFKIPSNVHHGRSSSSPYGGYQGFYTTPHHQMVRPNGYIDLVPR